MFLFFYTKTGWTILCCYSNLLDHSRGLNYKNYLFFFTIIIITRSILLYSVSYIDRKHLTTYLILIIVFSLSILVFISSTNLFRIILGWDGLGVSSFFLIFFFSSKLTISPRVITLLINRVGDITLILRVVIIKGSFHSYGDFIFTEELFFFFLLVTSLTKSAQFPFIAWLPAAIRAPTPTSALVHSSTLVTAGVFLISQYSDILMRNQKLNLIYLSLLTLFISRTATIFSWDIKKIIALSTLSQLRVIFLMLVSINTFIIINHLLNHAVFKALLFISCGWVIYNREDWQEKRILNIRFLNNPYILRSFFISLFALIGLPFRASFYSKHIFMDFLSLCLVNFWFCFNTFIIIIITLIYSTKLSLIITNTRKNKRFKVKSEFFSYAGKRLQYITGRCLFTGALFNYTLLKNVKIFPSFFFFKFLFLYYAADMLNFIYFKLFNSNNILGSLILFQQSTNLVIIKLIKYKIIFFNWYENILLERRVNNTLTRIKIRSITKITNEGAYKLNTLCLLIFFFFLFCYNIR